MADKHNNVVPEPLPDFEIRCRCGNNAFIQAHILAPGKVRPVKRRMVWMCAGCGMKFLEDDFPKKGEEETRKDSGILLPDGVGKLLH